MPRPSSSNSARCDTPPSIGPTMRWRCAAEITGPMSTPAWSPAPTLSFAAFSRSSGSRASPAAPTATTVETAMQRSPAEP
jgi:hypothetical protein